MRFNREKLKAATPAIVAAAIGIALYLPTLRGTLIYDDLFHLTRDTRLKDPALWGQYLTSGYFPGATDRLWRPLTSLSYAVQYYFAQVSPWSYHLVNILLYGIACALVAELARRLAGARVAWLGGLLFAVHPLHVEAVAYIVGRAETMCAIGVLGAMVLLCRPLTPRRALAVAGCVMVGVFSKEQGILAPAMLIGLWLLRRAQGEVDAPQRACARGLLAAMLLTLSAYIFWREHILGWTWDVGGLEYATQPMARSGLRDRILIPFALLGRYTQLLVFPLRLSLEYGLAVITPVQRLDDFYLHAGFAVAAALMMTLILLVRRRAGLALLLLGCAILSYGVIANVALIGTVFGERLIFLPSAFVLLLVAVGLDRIMQRSQRAGHRPALLVERIVFAVALALLAARTVTYALAWNDRLTFYQRQHAQSPQATRLHVLLAVEYLERKQFDQAMRIINDGIEVAPDYWTLRLLKVRILAEQGKLDEARKLLDYVWTLKPPVEEGLAMEQRLSEARERQQAATRPAP